TGIVAEKHTHPHQQVSYVEKGRFEVEIAGRKEILKAGDCFVIPSEAIHGAICLEEGSLIDTFSPLREDFLEPTGESEY
ncbi:MAG: cupin domain-containing protein, partial [Fidelibacterota bacterium]